MAGISQPVDVASPGYQISRPLFPAETTNPRRSSKSQRWYQTSPDAASCFAVLLRAAAQEVKFFNAVDLVTLLAAVRNRDGGIVDLSQDDFVLEEEGRVQTIRYFSQESNLPVTFACSWIRAAASLHVLESERKASYVFLDRMLREGDPSLHCQIRY